MNKSMRNVLKAIYNANSMKASHVVRLVESRYGDERDFYPLAALVEANYLGFTGGQPKKDEAFRNSLLAQTFQCYRQGRGRQTCRKITVFDQEGNEEIHFYVGPKAIEFFESRRSDFSKLLTSACLSFSAAVIVALITYCLRKVGGV